MSPVDKKIARALADAPKIVIATVALMEEMARVLISEIDVVTHRRMSEHPALLKYKQRLAVDYRANMKSLAAQPDVLKKLSEEAKAAVKTMAKRLSDAANANARALRASIDAARKLIHNIMAMVRQEALPRQTYKNHKKAHLELGKYSPTCRPIAVSRTV